MHGRGPLASTGVEVVALLRSPFCAGAATDVMLTCTALARREGWHAADPPPPGVTLEAHLVQPQSEGSVRLRAGDPFVFPVVSVSPPAAALVAHATVEPAG